MSPSIIDTQAQHSATEISPRRDHPSLAVKPAKNILRPVGQAIRDFAMIENNDRIMVAISGGKDSLSLLHILLHLQRHAPIRFELAAMTVDPQFDGFDPSHLKDYMADLGIPYFYERQPIAERAQAHMGNDSFCAFCSRMKRGIMYATARREGYSVIALGQHLDDLAESFLMSAFFAGQLRSMKAHYKIDSGDLRVIRPMVYVRERQTRDFARQHALPLVADSCPACFSMPSQRQEMKLLLRQQEKQHKTLFKNLRNTLLPMMHADFYQQRETPRR